MTNRRLQDIITRLLTAFLSLSLVFAFTSCLTSPEETEEGGRTVNHDSHKPENGIYPTETTGLPTGTYTSETEEPEILDYDYVKSLWVYTVWYDPVEDNPADYTAVDTADAFALKGVFYFSKPLTTVFEARLLKDGEVILTKEIVMNDNITAEADFSAGLQGWGVFEPGDYTVELLFEGKTVAYTGVVMKVV